MPTKGTPVKIDDLTSNTEGVSLIFKVLTKGYVERTNIGDRGTHRVCEFLVGDETGTVILSLFDEDIKKIQEEKVYEISHASTIVKDKHLRLIIDKKGEIKESSKKIVRINRTNAKSDEVQGFRLFRRQRKSWGKDY